MERLKSCLDELGLVAVRTDPLVVALCNNPERQTAVPLREPLERHLRAAKKRLLLAASPDQANPKPSCCPPAADTVTLGAWDFANAVMSDECGAAVQAERLGKCAVCAEARIGAEGQATTERLYRNVDGAPYCGTPWAGPRNAYREGCGCPLRSKVKYRAAQCPRGLWGPDTAGAMANASDAASPSVPS